MWMCFSKLASLKGCLGTVVRCANWNLITSWLLSFCCILFTIITKEVWSGGLAKIWFKSLTVFKCETLYKIRKIAIFNNLIPATNLSTYVLNKIDNEDNSFEEYCFKKYQSNLTKFIAFSAMINEITTF